MTSILSNAKIAKIFAKGILASRKKEYRLHFVYVPEDKLWYIDMPWPGDRYNLAMVAGSDKLLDYLSEEVDNNYVTLDVLPRNEREEHPGYFECEQTAYTLTGGSFYDVHDLEGFGRDIWICPVTLCVLGHYPKFIYIRKISKMEELLETKLSDLDLEDAPKICTYAIKSLGLVTISDLVNCDVEALTKKCGLKYMTYFDDLLESLDLCWQDTEGYKKYRSDCNEFSQWLDEGFMELEEMDKHEE